jgi:hypothetical protein
MAIVDFVFRDFNAHRCATTTKSPRPLFCNQLRFQLASDRIESGKASEPTGGVKARKSVPSQQVQDPSGLKLGESG